MKTTIDTICSWINGKVCGAGCKGVILGLSGGIDSAVVADLCIRSLSKDKVFGIIMPCESQKEDKEDALLVAKHLGMNVSFIDLGSVFQDLTFTNNKSELANIKLANANLKARLRMIALYYIANISSYLVVGTGNRTEEKVGYFTKYGDGGIDILPIGDLYKTQVFELAKALNLPEKIINKVPSAGLWKGQGDEEEMGIKYKELDRILIAIDAWILSGRSSTHKEFCKKENIEMEDFYKVQKMITNSEHKRHPPPICLL